MQRLSAYHSYFRRERQCRPGEDHEVREVPHEPPHPARQARKAQIVRHAPSREAVDYVAEPAAGEERRAVPQARAAIHPQQQERQRQRVHRAPEREHPPRMRRKQPRRRAAVFQMRQLEKAAPSAQAAPCAVLADPVEKPQRQRDADGRTHRLRLRSVKPNTMPHTPPTMCVSWEMLSVFFSPSTSSPPR